MTENQEIDPKKVAQFISQNANIINKNYDFIAKENEGIKHREYFQNNPLPFLMVMPKKVFNEFTLNNLQVLAYANLIGYIGDYGEESCYINFMAENSNVGIKKTAKFLAENISKYRYVGGWHIENTKQV